MLDIVVIAVCIFTGIEPLLYFSTGVICERTLHCITFHTSLQSLVTDAPTHSRWLKLRYNTVLHFCWFAQIAMVAERREATSRVNTHDILRKTEAAVAPAADS